MSRYPIEDGTPKDDLGKALGLAISLAIMAVVVAMIIASLK